MKAQPVVLPFEKILTCFYELEQWIFGFPKKLRLPPLSKVSNFQESIQFCSLCAYLLVDVILIVLKSYEGVLESSLERFSGY